MDTKLKEDGKPGRHGGYTGKDIVAAFGPGALTEKQRNWILHYLEFGNATRAALACYECSSYGAATVIGSRNLRVLRVPMKAYLDHKGFGLEDLYRTMKEGLVATKYEKTGPVAYSETPDHAVREKFLRHASKWLDVPAPADVEMESQGGIVVNVYEPSLRKGFKGRGKEVEDQPEEDTDIF